jgi:hypothetical protein
MDQNFGRETVGTPDSLQKKTNQLMNSFITFGLAYNNFEPLNVYHYKCSGRFSFVGNARSAGKFCYPSKPIQWHIQNVFLTKLEKQQ